MRERRRSLTLSFSRLPMQPQHLHDNALAKGMDRVEVYCIVLCLHKLRPLHLYSFALAFILTVLTLLRERILAFLRQGGYVYFFLRRNALTIKINTVRSRGTRRRNTFFRENLRSTHKGQQKYDSVLLPPLKIHTSEELEW